MGSKSVDDVVLGSPQATLLYTSTDEPCRQLAKLASVCYDSGRLRTMNRAASARFLDGLVTAGHLGVLEHVTATFDVTCSRACSHQIVRHRVGFSYLQRSNRHVAPTESPSIEWNRGMTQCEKNATGAVLRQAYADAFATYEQLIADGTPREIARYVLPEMTGTHMYVTANLRAWRDFLSKRLPSNAQDEIRILAMMIYVQLNEYCPPAMRGLVEVK